MAGKIAYGTEMTFQKENDGDKMSKIEHFKELLRDLEDLRFIDGYGECWWEHCDDEICATSQFYSYKELAEKYNVNYEKYGLDEDGENNEVDDTIEIWGCAENVSWEINKKITAHMMELIGPEEKL